MSSRLDAAVNWMQIEENNKAPCYWPLWGEILAQRACNTENVSIWWRHHAMPIILSSTHTHNVKIHMRRRSTWRIDVTYLACQLGRLQYQVNPWRQVCSVAVLVPIAWFTNDRAMADATGTSFGDLFKDFLNNTTLHGARYLEADLKYKFRK